MKFLSVLAAFLAINSSVLLAADKDKPAKTTFVVSGLECASCVYVVQYALSQTPGVTDVEMVQSVENFARVSYDPKMITEHQLAQTVREAPPIHGMPYIAAMKLRVQGYAEKGNAVKVKAFFAKWKDLVEMNVMDESKGELLVHFQPLEMHDDKPTPRGWTLQQLANVIQEPAPKGLGLKVEVIE